MNPDNEVPSDGLSDAIDAHDRELLHDLIDGRLSQREAAALHQRLEHQPALRHALQELQQLGTWLRDEWDRAEPPALDPLHLADRVLARTLAAVPASSLPHREAPERLATWEFREAPPSTRRFPWALVSGFSAAAVVVAGATWFIWSQWTRSDYEHVLPPHRSEARMTDAEESRAEDPRVDRKDLHSKAGAEREKSSETNDLDRVVRESTEALEGLAEAGSSAANKQVLSTVAPEAETRPIENPSVYSVRNEADGASAQPPVVPPSDDRKDSFFAQGFREAWRGFGEFFGGAEVAEPPASEALRSEPSSLAIELDKLAEERLLRALSQPALAEAADTAVTAVTAVTDDTADAADAAEAPVVPEVEAGRRAEKVQTADLGRYEAAWREQDREALRDCARIVVDRYEVVATERALERAGHDQSTAELPRLNVEQSHLRAAVAWNALQSEWTRLESAPSGAPQAASREEAQGDRGLTAGFVLPAAPAEEVLLLKLTVQPGQSAASLGQTIESLGLRSIALSNVPPSKAEMKNAFAPADTAPVSELYLGWLNSSPAADAAPRDSEVALRYMLDPLIEGQHTVSGSIVASATIQLALVQAVQEAEVDQWLVQAEAENGASPLSKDNLALGSSSQPVELKREEAKLEDKRTRAKSAGPTGSSGPGAASGDTPSAPGGPAAPKSDPSIPGQRGNAGGGAVSPSPTPKSEMPSTPAEQRPDPASEPRPTELTQAFAFKEDEALQAVGLRLAKAWRERTSARPLRVMVVLENQNEPNSSDKKVRDK